MARQFYIFDPCTYLCSSYVKILVEKNNTALIPQSCCANVIMQVMISGVLRAWLDSISFKVSVGIDLICSYSVRISSSSPWTSIVPRSQVRSVCVNIRGKVYNLYPLQFGKWLENLCMQIYLNSRIIIAGYIICIYLDVSSFSETDVPSWINSIYIFIFLVRQNMQIRSPNKNSTFLHAHHVALRPLFLDSTW